MRYPLPFVLLCCVTISKPLIKHPCHNALWYSLPAVCRPPPANHRQPPPPAATFLTKWAIVTLVIRRTRRVRKVSLPHQTTRWARLVPGARYADKLGRLTAQPAPPHTHTACVIHTSSRHTSLYWQTNSPWLVFHLCSALGRRGHQQHWGQGHDRLPTAWQVAV